MESVIAKVKGCTKSLQVSQSSRAWRSDSAECLTITFQSFVNGIKVIITETLLPKVIQNLFTYMYAEGYEIRVSLYLAI